MKVVFLCLLLLSVTDPGWTFKFYQNAIPNGDKVPNPCGGSGWQGVGHFNQQGGGTNNQFGLDFAAADHKWTSALCRMDSDSDGKTNGEELGDPNCLWTPGSTTEGSATSHPGICEPLNAPRCASVNSRLNCAGATFTCPQLKENHVRSFDVRMPRNNIPSRLTTYMCVTVDLPADDDYHVIGLEPMIDNTAVLHHAIVYGCPANKVRGAPRDKAEQCGMAGVSCNEYIAGWTLGTPGHCFSPDVGFHIGKNSFQTVKMTVHYTNVQLRSDLWDSTAMRLYYTAQRRKYDSGTLRIGTNDITIPPGMTSLNISGTCPSQCTSRWPGSVKILDGFLHAHYLGQDLEVTHRHNGVRKSILRDTPYKYDNPRFQTLKTPLNVVPGDELTLRCGYQSKDRKTVTRFGQGTYDEMCLAFLTYYPRLPDRPLPSCVARRGKGACSAASSKCDIKSLNTPQVKSALARVVSDCRAGCSLACASAVAAVRANPCESDPTAIKASQKIVPAFPNVYNKMKSCTASKAKTNQAIKTNKPTSTFRPATTASQCTANYYLKSSSGRQILRLLPSACKSCGARCSRVLTAILRSACMQEPIRSQLRAELLRSKDGDAQTFFKTLDTAVVSCLKPGIG